MMTCPYYRGKQRCGLKSEFYMLTQESVENYYKVNEKACDIFCENKKSGVEERVEKLDESQKI